ACDVPRAVAADAAARGGRGVFTCASRSRPGAGRRLLIPLLQKSNIEAYVVCRTPHNPTSRSPVYQQILDPVAHSLAWSSLVAAIPLLLLFVLLGVLKVTAWVASLISLAVAIVVAVLVYGMP